MSFLIAYFVVAISCIIITGRTLIAYTEYTFLIKFMVYTFLSIAWFSPILVWSIQAKLPMPIWLYTIIAKSCYFLFGFAFLLAITLLMRDILWAVIYYISNKNIISPSDHNTLNYLNIITIFLVVMVSIYAVYSAEKMPQILNYKYTDTRIKRKIKILLVSDLHITKMTPINKVNKWVEYFNNQHPDIILMVGDIADDKVDDIEKQINELKKLKAPLGIYYAIGNHETYFNAYAWEAKFASLGWRVLHNSGVSVDNTGIYIAGLPDLHGFSSNLKQAVHGAKPDEYRILLSHLPITVKYAQNNDVDLQVSGHTHGGQIFPFNFLTKHANGGFVAGEYTMNNTTLLVTRGVGYWGPPMRLVAPNDIIIIELTPLS